MDTGPPPPPFLPPPPPRAVPPVLATAVAPAAEPPVLRWYRVYLGAMAALYLGCFALGVLFLVLREEIADWPPVDDPTTFVAYGIVLAATGAVLHTVYFGAFFLPRRPWAWIAHLVLIALGLASCCMLPAAIPLLVSWRKPETRAWFGRRAGSV